MSRTPTDRPRPLPASRRPPGRRAVLAVGTAGAAAGAGALLGLDSGSAAAGGRAPSETAARADRLADAASRRPSPEGTTLASVATPRGPADGYRQLAAGPGWPRETRTDLAEAGRRQAGKRTPLASFVQFTDMHLTDVQHPLRYEYLRAGDAGAWRPQEALTVAGAVSLVERVNALGAGPATGEPLSFVMTTGDNTDNNCHVELDWFLTVMSGGRITPNTGDGKTYEGVQDSGLKLYWQPEAALRDADKQLGYPRIGGFLRAALRELNSPGLKLPWYSTVGNHDALTGGSFPAAGNFFADFAVGGRKLMTLEADEATRLSKIVREGSDPDGEAFQELLRGRRRARALRAVTPDTGRAPFTREEYVRAHLQERYAGAGPVGHGYTNANLTEGRLYYTFRVSESVVGISLDTTRPDGRYTGRVSDGQLRWLERRLTEARKEGSYVLLFSHHPSASTPEGGRELVALLQRHPHVLAWMNGHTHRNKIVPHGTFWEVSTASHVDFPQLARTVELADNGDGALSLFTTLIESAAPHRTAVTDLSQTGLAALYRELGLNAPGVRKDLAGSLGDRNTELLLRKP